MRIVIHLKNFSRFGMLILKNERKRQKRTKKNRENGLGGLGFLRQIRDVHFLFDG